MLAFKVTVMVSPSDMESYSAHLKGLFGTLASQTELASQIGKTPVAVNRYANGQRFPDADTARAIDRATEGKVPFEMWQAEALKRIGLGEAA